MCSPHKIKVNFENLAKTFGKCFLSCLWKKRFEWFLPNGNKWFVVIIASYNNKDWYKKNLDSVFMQKYDNYRIVYIDDASTDYTGDLVMAYAKEKGKDAKITLIKNEKRLFTVANIYTVVHACNNDEIAVILDGDDWFAHDKVLTLLDKVYTHYDVWLTYGQYREYPSGTFGRCKSFPKNIIKTNNFRDYPWITSHLRTFYVWLFKLIKKEDLLYQGNSFYPMAGDFVIMYPMLEMAGHKIKCISVANYIYNRATSFNEDKVNINLQANIEKNIRAKKRYKALKQRELT